jgi:hypothetical protein
MSELRSKVAALYRAEMAEEVAAGFPTLRRIPSTPVVRFLDYWGTLEAPEQDALLDTLAWFGSVGAEPERAAAETAERQQNPVLARLNAALAFRGFNGGYRYTPMKILGGVSQSVGGLAGWIQNGGFSSLELQPRDELLPSVDLVQPVKPARLKRLVDRTLADLFSPRKAKFGSELSKYTGVYDHWQLTVDVLFAPSARLNPRQLQYVVSAVRSEPTGERCTGGGTYEGLWSLHANWDYITEENAERSIDLLRDLVVYLVQLGNRVHSLRQGAS